MYIYIYEYKNCSSFNNSKDISMCKDVTYVKYIKEYL